MSATVEHAAAPAAEAWAQAFFATPAERLGALEYVGDELPATRSSAAATADMLRFSVAEEDYAADLAYIQEIIKPPTITELPRVRAGVLGIISLRGVIVPVVDLRQLLRLPACVVTGASRVLILRQEGEPLGLLVDGVSHVVRLERSVIEPRPRGLRRDAAELLAGIGRSGGNMLMLLDVAALLASVESLA